MNRALSTVAVALVLVLFSLAIPVAGNCADDVPRISPEALKAMLDDPGLALLDARITGDWRKAKLKIKGAVRANPHDISSWASNYPKDQKIVLYCSWAGEATSASVAGRLIKLGYTDVQVLKGGWNKWVKKGYPTEARE